MWDIKSSKFYTEIMGALTAFFSTPEATESELHQKLTDAGTIDAIRQEAQTAAEAACAAEIAQLNAQVTTLGDSFKALETEAASKDAAISEQAEEAARLAAELETKTAEVATLTEQLAKVSGELATLKAAKPVFASTNPDASLPIPEQKAKPGNAMSESELMAFMN